VEASQNGASRRGTREQPLTTYEQWARDQGIPIVDGFYAHLNQVEVAPWERVCANGALVRLSGSEEGYTDGQVVEIPPGGHTKPQKHLYEETTYILSGRGATTVWYDEGSKQSFEWKQHSLFALPPNACYQHFNLSGDAPARYYSVTDAPLLMDLFHNMDFIWNNDFRFTDRYEGKDGHFSGRGSFLDGGHGPWDTNYLADVNAFELKASEARGAGGTNVLFELGNSTLIAHVSEFPVGTYKKAHRHGPGASVIILSGTGYTIHWHEDGPKTRVDWVPGTTFVPENMGFHQHFNTGQEPARYLAIRWGNGKYRFFRPRGAYTMVSTEEGGDQIEYANEDPEIYQTYLAECAKHGVTPKMERLLAAAGRKV